MNNIKAMKAAAALRYYFKLIADKAGVKLDSDCEAEIRDIVENILDAAGDYTDEAIDSHNGAQIYKV